MGGEHGNVAGGDWEGERAPVIFVREWMVEGYLCDGIFAWHVLGFLVA